MKFLKSQKWIIPALVVVIVLAIGIFAKVAFDTNVFGPDFRTLVLGTFQKNPFKKQSQVSVSLIDSKLNLNFDLIPEDKPKFASFIRNWFGVETEVKSLSFGIDDNMAAMMSQNLPVNLRLTVAEKSLGFSSNMAGSLQNPLIKSNFEFATGSSKLNAQVTDSSKYQIKIDNPEDLVNFATSSGQLSASSKLEGFFKTLPKVATIEVNVNGRNVSGRIVLR